MNWNDIIESRHTSYTWNYEKEIKPEVFHEICNEVYNHVPTKNLKYPYEINIFKNDDPEVRKDIMTICHRNDDLSIEEDGGNPQVLAPYIVALSQRDIGSVETLHQKKILRDPENTRFYNMVEIGVVMTYMILALTNRGIQTGICQNITKNSGYIKNLVGSEQNTIIIFGAGYETKENTYTDPRTGNKNKKIPYPPELVHKVYTKPDFDTVFKLHF